LERPQHPEAAQAGTARPSSATVNPSLRRQAQSDSFHGLFKVTDRLYHIRGLDDSNMTIVESDSDLVVIVSMASRVSLVGLTSEAET
jgi:alkyl sulfatase BDS1-like metallo-beta-lactamase superfamily hydrolase